MKLSREEAWAGTLESMVDNRVVFYLRRYNRDYQDYSRQMKEAILFVRGERPMLDDKYNLKKHPNVKWTEDGGAPPYDYAKAPRSHDDLNIDIERLDDYELLCEEDILGKEQPF